MRKISVAVCDRDRAYGSRLGEWISLEKGDRLLGCSFSTPEGFLEFRKGQRTEVVLLGCGFQEDIRILEQIEESRTDGREEVNSRTDTVWMYLHDPEQEAEVPEAVRKLPVIEKYQAAPEIVRDIFLYYQKYGGETQESRAIEKEVLGVYSPGHSILQTPFALTLAQAFTGKGKVLYVNLKECAGFSRWLQEKYQRDLLDAMYLCLNGERNIADCIRSVVCSLEGFDYIPPAEDGICLGETDRKDYGQFITLLAEKSGYDVVILDFGMMIPGFFDILEKCSHVYIPSEPGELQEEAVYQFRQMMSRQNRPLLEEHVTCLRLPPVETGRYQGVQRLQQWVWGELGDCARELAGG